MRRKGIVLIIAVLTPLLLMAAGDKSRTSAGPSTGKITGTVTDRDSGRPVVGASVLVVGTQRGAQTDFEGKFSIMQVEPGAHALRVTAVGYEPADIRNVDVKAGKTTEVPVRLTRTATTLDKGVTVVGKQDDLKVRETSNEAAATKPATTVDELLNRGAAVEQKAEGDAYTRARRAPEASSAELFYRNYNPPPAHGGTDIVNGEPYDAMFFKNYGTNPFVDTDEDNLSTFAIDVDDASYILARSYLYDGNLPAADAVRTEEFVNHFDYGYAPPRREAFRVYIDGAPSYFGANSRLLRIGIKGREIDPEDRRPANLVFVIDVSGSMAREDRLELVKRSLTYLVDQLDERDRVGIVVYGTRGRVVLEPTSAANRSRILRAIKRLGPEGATNAEEGIRLGYQMAARNFDSEKTNRIILCSDGVANVGITGPDEILKLIKRHANRGITLTTVGFGMGNYNDVLMEQLGNKGNGFYAYVDDIEEARRVFVDNLTGALEVIARDVKIQVDFNPEVVRSYRLLGYENRDVADHKFRDDRVDGGEIGAGHEVTALYEIKLWSDRGGYSYDEYGRDDSRIDKRAMRVPRDADLGTVFIRYKDPDDGDVAEVRRPIGTGDFALRFDQASADFRLAAAAAEFAEILRKSYWAKDSDLSKVRRVVKGVADEYHSPDVKELLDLVKRAERFEDQLAER